MRSDVPKLKPQDILPPQPISVGKRGAAAILGLSVSTIEKNLHRIPHFRFGKRVLFAVEALRLWVKEQA